MKKDRIFLITILLTAIILRILCLDKTGGLWYDEIVTYKEAVKVNAVSVIYYTLKTDVHLPLYQLFLHYWGKIFSFTDISLRAFSVFCGVLTTLIAYFIGKNLSSKKTGLFCSGLFAINSFLIYYSQEVRMYSFLMLLASLQLLFMLKIKNTGKNIDYIAFTILSTALVYTQTIGFIYAGSSLAIFLSYMLIKKENQKAKKILKSSLGVLFLSIPLILYMSIFSGNYTNQINGYYCDWSSLFVVFQDIFTPVLKSITHNPIHYMHELITTISLSRIFFIILPMSIYTYCIYLAVKKDKFSNVLLLSALTFFLAEIIAFKVTNFKIMSRYISIFVPNILILAGYGLSLIENKKHHQTIITGFLILINFSYFIFSPNAAFKLPREGYRPLADMINQSKIHSNDFVVVWNRKEILDKYVKENINILSILKDFAYKSEVILENEKELNKMSLDKRKEVLHEYFTSTQIPRNTHLLMGYIINNMHNGQKFIITSSEYFDHYTSEDLKKLSIDDKAYTDISYNNLLTIKSLLDIKTICFNSLKFIKKEQNSDYVIYVFEK